MEILSVVSCFDHPGSSVPVLELIHEDVVCLLFYRDYAVCLHKKGTAYSRESSIQSWDFCQRLQMLFQCLDEYFWDGRYHDG